MNIKKLGSEIVAGVMTAGLEETISARLDAELASEQELINNDSVMSTEEKIKAKRKSVGFYLLCFASVLTGFAVLRGVMR